MDVFSILYHLRALQLQLEPVRNEGDEFTVRGLALGVTHRVAKEALQGVQIPSVPGDFDGVANGPLYPAGGGLEGLGHLGVQDLGDGVRAVGPPEGTARRMGLIALFVVP